MRIFHAKVLIDGAFVEGGVDFDARIRQVGAGITDGDLDAQGCYLIPGLVDIHTHAAVGEDASDGKPEGIPVMSRYYAAGGVTSWCPTTMTIKEPLLMDAMRAIRDFTRPADGAKVAGINLEGPFLSRAKCGAQDPDSIHAPDVEMFQRLNDACGGIVRLVSVAPEEPGAIPFIEEVSKICAVSVGHTAADYDAAMAAYKAGASHATHLYNAMPSLHHRQPGVIPAACDSGATAELICDGIHVHPAMVRLAFRLFPGRIALISDSLRCAGMPDGEYTLGGQPITFRNGRATLTGTDTIAGSSIHLMDGVRRAVEFGIPLEEAVTAATLTPARAIRVEDRIGSLEEGKCADLVLLDSELQVKAVYVDGRPIHKN